MHQRRESPSSYIYIRQNLTGSLHCVLLQASDHVLLQHNVYGGAGGAAAGMEFKLVTTFPDALQFRCLCAKCGIQVPSRFLPLLMRASRSRLEPAPPLTWKRNSAQDLPGTSDDWCTNKCLCIHQEVGLKDWMEQQCLVRCLAPCCAAPLFTRVLPRETHPGCMVLRSACYAPPRACRSSRRSPSCSRSGVCCGSAVSSPARDQHPNVYYRRCGRWGRAGPLPALGALSTAP
jgi:hypothetical protein